MVCELYLNKFPSKIKVRSLSMYQSVRKWKTGASGQWTGRQCFFLCKKGVNTIYLFSLFALKGYTKKINEWRTLSMRTIFPNYDSNSN